jgi:hypothetical protein
LHFLLLTLAFYNSSKMFKPSPNVFSIWQSTDFKIFKSNQYPVKIPIWNSFWYSLIMVNTYKDILIFFN